jgi:23S rRNA pseudouridine1911/1915/1917 synthase
VKVEKFIPLNEDFGERLDVYLAKKLNFSRSYVKRLIKSGEIMVNGGLVKPHYKVRNGDLVEVCLRDLKEETPKKGGRKLNILYEDEEIIVVNKPAGLVVHPATGKEEETVVGVLLSHTQLSTLGAPNRPGVVHRLDKETSGILVVTKTDSAYWNLRRQFESKKIKKKYLTIVHGLVKHSSGKIEAPISRGKGKMEVKIGKSAVTRFRVLRRFKIGKEAYSLLELIPETGRTHQLRVHLRYIGHPILGDKKYGRKDKLMGRQALHATFLGFYHPRSGEYLQFETHPPEDFTTCLKHLESLCSLTPHHQPKSR